jgi:divalent metal cation (Fe/Co/Zn/Cd) transporter
MVDMTGTAARLRRQGFLLEYLSMAWMTLEAAIAIAAGVAAHSIALIGFGLDSVIEFVAGALVVWELWGADQQRERSATRLIGVTFFLLAGYVAVEAIRDLLTHARPEPSLPGLAITVAALIVMPALAVGKHRVGRALNNRTLLADAAETTFCALLSATTILGLGMNALFGWGWADPLAALVIAGLAVREGLEAWEDADERD